MVGNKPSLLLVITAVMASLSGCTQSLGGCGVGYEEMYGGYDYEFSNHDIANDNSLNVTVRLQNGGGGWIEDSDEFEEHQTIWVTLNIKLSNGNEVQIKPNHQTWEVNGDAWNESYWGTNLYFSSPAGFCDNGCEQIRFSAGDEFGFIYYDGTCDSSPWIDID
ncbi:MAG: hypothetical protein MKZ55_01930 [Candidatus Thalassarchaeum sp.]|nr:hypothetical protein [Candidatus Thalassarchaeum sp.]